MMPSPHPTLRHLAVAVTVVFAAGAAMLGCSNAGDQHADDTGASSPTTAPSTSSPSSPSALERPYGVGLVEEVFVDDTRPTSGAAGRAEQPNRTVETTILYPANVGSDGGIADGAEPADRGGPFPLVVLGHGLGGNVEYLTPLAERWASAGYVVALPRFPLTRGDTPGGIDGADVQNQPGDVSFVIDEVLASAKRTDTPLAGLVDAGRIGAAGHSNGAITTLGVVANSCCRDRRIDTAIVLSGTPSPYADGAYDFDDMAPTMFVHGVHDQLVDYNQTVDTFNKASTPKALLTLEAADHSDWLAPTNEAFDVTAQATIDFLDGYLRDDPTAIERLGSDQSPAVATMHFSPVDAAAVTVETIPTAATNREATVSADTDLRDGQAVTVTWSGFLPGKTVNVLQCVGDGRGGTASCGIAEGHVLLANPTGAGTVDLTIHTGTFAGGTCDAQNPCTILVNDSGLLDEDAFRRFPITFAG